MSKLVERAPTPADFVVRNTAGKRSKQMSDGPMPDEKLCEICDKHYNQLLPLTKEKTQLSESESCDKKIQSKKRRRPSPSTMSRGSHPSQSPSVFSRLKHGEPVSPRRKILTSTTVFTRLGEREKNVFTRLGTGITKIIRKWSKPGKHEHKNEKSAQDPGV
ncbi:hypothetical protein Tco_1034198 [Tanacetum coccineum]